MEEVTSNKRKMQELEDNLLYRLTSTKGSLVDDESLIEVLRTTKVTAEEVTQKLDIAAQTEIKINSAREEYRPVAARGSVLYFLIVEMSMVNVMYQTSLTQFLDIFDLSMSKSAKSPVTAKRISNIIEFLTFESFRYSTRGLYEEHKFLFTLLLTLKIDLQKGHVKHHEFQTLIKGGAALDLKTCPPKSSKWITDITWLNLVELSKLQQFSEVITQISRNDKAWKAWFDTEAPEENPIPDGYNSLDTFRKLLLVRSWCPDRTYAQARKYVAESMGIKYAEGVILDVEGMWHESLIRVPMICLLSMGSDPTMTIDGLAKKHQIECHTISMGQGQEVHARRLLTLCQTEGGWLLLQNGHLALGFLDELLQSVLDTPNVHEIFRLWMTTEVHPKFPINLLQASIKYTFAPPQGVKAGIKRTYSTITQEQLDYSNLPQWKPMLYAVAFLHTTVQERRKFGPLGWNIPYEFNQSDFNASTQYVQNLLDELDLKKGVSWGAVRYMLGEIQYGGRVTDDYDNRLLNTYAKVWFGEHMFQQNFRFYKGYSIPVYKTTKEYMDFIELLPLVDTPEIFGMHTNADITYQSNTAKACLDTILEIQPKDSSGGGGETRETIVRRQAGEMLEKLPADYLPHEVRARLQKMGALAPMNIFLRQEIDRMQRIIGLVRSTLQDLQLAIDGTIVMSEGLRKTLDSMYDAKVPPMWSKISWESTTSGFWFTELLERDVQFRAWVFTGRPSSFWMTGLFNPQGFLTAMRQEVARAHKGWALDSVVLYNDVTKINREEITGPPAEGVYIYGLFLDGAGWDKRNQRLQESIPKVLYVNMPVVHVFAINTREGGRDPKLYVCPVYKKPRRTDLTFITPLYLRTVQNSDHWVTRGVALLCDIK